MVLERPKLVAVVRLSLENDQFRRLDDAQAHGEKLLLLLPLQEAARKTSLGLDSPTRP